MDELFKKENIGSEKVLPPLAERMRPNRIEEVLGQDHLLGENGPLKKFFENKKFPSMIFWGPPGVGKTTIAYLIAKYGDYNFVRISAVEAGVKEVKEIINRASIRLSHGQQTLLFIDEIHRFNKAQQDYLLHSVEKGIITLVGATTENPSFEVIPALLSRCQVYKLNPLGRENIVRLINAALERDIELSKYNIRINDYDTFFILSGGDARVALNLLEIAFNLSDKSKDEIIIDKEIVYKASQQKTLKFNKKGDYHYDTISAFIKSLRGSDPDAALIWLAKMIDSGEDPLFIARRMIIFASEDVGNSDPLALPIAVSVYQAVQFVGMPEAQINLAQGATYLASCPKSNASYMGLINALEIVKNSPEIEVPLHLRNAPTRLMEQFGYGINYKYPHDYPEHFVDENYFPIGIDETLLYNPTDIGYEKRIKERLEKLWNKRYKKTK
ncbi:replication-associated recombination protein A [Bacteroidetes/Chlorobi group bacterium MS-B_bin-24]|nr:MAG: replication-associated recombination protein A [Bacteroidetes/Chlorobi group bacterium MS-B_bin-24]